MTERDFVLNNIAKLMNNDYPLGHTIADLKSIYKTICENTSEESDSVKTARIDEIIEQLKTINKNFSDLEYDNLKWKSIEMLENLKKGGEK